MKLDTAYHVLLELPGRYSIYKRIALLALSIFVSISCGYVWVTSHVALNNHYHSQANQLGSGLANQYQVILQRHLKEKNTDRMQLVVNTLVNDQFVLSASVFDQFGREVIAHPQSPKFRQLYTNTSVLTPLTFVSEIREDGKILGYLRLVMDGKLASSYVGQLEWAFLSRTLVIMLLALLTGIILTRSFYKWRMKSVKIKKERKF